MSKPAKAVWRPSVLLAVVVVATCWRVSAQRDEELMPSAAVSPASSVTNQAVPAIISFQTGARQGYVDTSGVAELKLVVTAVEFFRLEKADGSAVLAGDEVLKADAHRTVCGVLFEELWSSDGRGFPYPSGCYYGQETATGAATSREFGIVFETSAGFAPSTRYQIAVRATMKQGVKLGDEVIHLRALDDAGGLIEVGLGGLSLTPAAAASSASPQLTSLTLDVGATGDSVSVDDASSPLQVKLTGDAARPLTAESHLRLLLRPLTSWALGPACAATCQPAATGQLCGTLGQCMGEAVVQGEGRNIAHLTLPTSLTPIGGASVTPTLELWGLDLPAQAFFPVKLGAQVTDDSDSFPQYIESTDTIHRFSPPGGSIIASLVTTDGDTKPFEGDAGNELYVRIAFAATLFSVAANDDASFLLTLPAGYTCVDGAGAEDTLRFFSFDALPQRRGTLSGSTVTAQSDGEWTFSSNTCEYKLHANSAIYAGSVVMLKLTVDNPSSALPYSAGASWTMQLKSKGEVGGGSILAMTTEGFVVPSSATVGDVASRLATAAVVLGKLTDGLLQPSDYTARAKHKIRVFFRAPQSTGLRASLLLAAPDDFDFGEEPCNPQDLEDYIYASGSTTALPGVLGCSPEGRSGAYGAYGQARISLDGEILGGNRYAFQLDVTNPIGESLSLATLEAWHLTVLSASGHSVDGSAEPLLLNLAESAGMAWGLYGNRFEVPDRLGIEVSSYRPFSLSGTLATVTVFPIQTLETSTSRLRIIAPFGYEWNISNAKYEEEAAGAAGVPGTSADLPGGLPTVTLGGSTLEWAAAAYDKNKIYGFIAEIKVPDASPTASVNAFFVELGDWDSGDVADRLEAAVVDASDVHALQDAAVSAVHTMERASATLTLQVRTISTIPAGGALLITSPANFSFAAVCEAALLQVPSGGPSGLACSASTNAQDEAEVFLTNRKTTEAMPPGLYSLQVAITNPEAATNAVSGSTPCGYEQCWTFVSLQDAADTSGVLDLQASVPGFAVHSQMAHAGMVPLTEDQRLAIKQSTRPGHSTRAVFSVELAQVATSTAEMLVRGPPGVRFNTNCLPGVKTASASVFGRTELWDAATYSAWPSAAQVTACRGSANLARLEIEAGLLAGPRYAWQMGFVAALTDDPQSDNVWSIDYNAEASLPFQSFNLSTFTDTLLTPTSPAASIVTPFFLEFRPRTSIPGGGGVLVLQAPTPFYFEHQGGACEIELMSLPQSGGEFKFDSQDLRCRVDEESAFTMTVEPSLGIEILAGMKHRLIAHVRNPEGELASQAWMLQSFSSQATDLASALDEGQFLGFPVVKAATLWSIKFRSGVEKPQNKGFEDVTLKLWATLSAELLTGDVLQITGPSSFSFVDASAGGGQCNDFEWDTGVPSGAPVVADLNDVAVSCSASRILVTYSGAAEIAVGAQLALLFKTRNPRVTPAASDNYWRFDHRRGDNVACASLAHGYHIKPQLESVSVSLLGPPFAAQSKSKVQLTFRVVSNCTLIHITAEEPSGFGLAAAKLSSALVSTASGNDEQPLSDAVVVPANLPATATMLMPSPILKLGSTGASSILIAASVREEQSVRLVLDDVKLAGAGGETLWSIETFAGAASLDRRSAAGFRQPGLISVIHKSLRNELDPALSPPPRTESEVAIMSSWSPRVSSPGIAEFMLRFSNDVAMSENLTVSTDADYFLDSEGLGLFSIDATGQLVPVPVALSRVSAQAISLTLLQALRARSDVSLVVPVVTASASASLGFWHFETRDDGELPTHTNDAQTLGFEMVEIFTIRVSAAYAPPTATFVVDLALGLGTASVRQLRVILPAAYTAPPNCTVSAAAACEQRIEDGGRSLYLSSSGSLFSGNLTLQALVTAPAVEPPEGRAWIVSGRRFILGPQAGWGEDREGFRLTPLGGIEVRYAGVPLTTVSLAISFEVRWRDGGAQIPRVLQILPPATYELSCDERFLRLISMPGNSSVCSVDPFTLGLAGERPFPEGSHTFMLAVKVPRETPQASGATASGQLDPFFKVLLLEGSDAQGSSKVVDSNMQVLASPVLSLLLRVQQPVLSWTFSRPLSEPFITVRLNLERNVAAGVTPFRFAALLLEIPEGFKHVITSASDVRSLNSEFPHPEDWAQYDRTGSVGSYFAGANRTLRKIRLLRDETKRVPLGHYGWAFPVSIPLVMPTENIWRLSLCSLPTCSDGGDASVLAAFVMPGFLHDEVSSVQGFDPDLVSGAARGGLRSEAAAGALLLLGCLLLAAPAA